LRYKAIVLDIAAKALGPTTRGSSSIKPHRIHTKADARLAITKGPGKVLLSSVRTTRGTVTSKEAAPTKPQKDEMRPVKKSARSAGRTNIAQTCKSANVRAALKYLWRLSKLDRARQCLKKAIV
jgi:hypothetical protein